MPQVYLAYLLTDLFYLSVDLSMTLSIYLSMTYLFFYFLFFSFSCFRYFLKVIQYFPFHF